MSDLEKRLAELSPEKRALFEKRLKQKSKPKARTRELIPKREGSGPTPASMDQIALWFFHQVDPDTIAYNMGFGQRLRGPFEHEIMERVLNTLVTRHEVMRTTFQTINSDLYQVISPSLTAVMPIHDLRDLPEQERDQVAQQLATRLIHIPFDLEKGPLFRFPIIRISESDFLYLIIIHHAITDWWSFRLFNREFSTLFQEYSKGKPNPLPPIPIQFADFSQWRNKWVGSVEYHRQMDYWLNQLEGANMVLDLPTDRPWPPLPSYQGRRHHCGFLGTQTLERIRAANARNKSTSLMTTLACTFAFLSRYVDVNDLIIGLSTADRENPQIEKMMGFILNILVIRCRFNEGTTFDELVKQVRNVVLEAAKHKDLPFRLLVEKLQPERELSRMPVYQIDFNHIFQEGPVFEGYEEVSPEEYIPGYEHVPFIIDREVAAVDLQINFTEFHDDITLMMEMNTDILEATTVARMSDLLRNLMSGMLAEPNRPIKSIDWLTSQERDYLLRDLSQRTLPYPHDRSVASLFEEKAGQRGDEIAVESGDDSLTYRQLERQANQRAHHLLAHGLKLGESVGLLLERHNDWIIAMLAVLKAGGVYVPLDPNYPVERLQNMISNSGMTHLLSKEEHRKSLPLQDKQSINMILLDNEVEQVTAEQVTPPDNRKLPSGAPIFTVYTSGTTGQPKGVSVGQRALLRLVFDTQIAQFTADDVFGATANPSFDIHAFEVWTALLRGVRLHLIDREALLDTELLRERIERHKITILYLTPSLLNQHAAEMPELFNPLTYLFTGGERADASAMRSVLAAGGPKHMLNMYGPSESAAWSTWAAITELDKRTEVVPFGRPIANTAHYVVDRHLHLVPRSVHGELLIGGDALALGYLNQPKLTAAAFIPDPFAEQAEAGARLYHSGDIVYRQDDGQLCFMNRIDKQVKLRGFRIELGEIGGAFARQPDVSEAHAIPEKDKLGVVRRIIAYVSPASGELDIADLRLRIAENLPDYMIPAAIIAVERFPHTANGKLDEAALPHPSIGFASHTYTPPRNLNEAQLAEIWTEVLDRDKLIGIHDNFFQVGGDSIMAIQAIAAANRCGFNLQTKHLFQNQTVAELATVAGKRNQIDAQQSSVTGTTELSPRQLENLVRPYPAHNNLSQMLVPSQQLEEGRLRRALESLAHHHDALRQRFNQLKGNWQQNYMERGLQFPLETLDYEDEPSLQAQCERIQASLNLEEGPLARAALCQGEGQPTRLLLVIHRLAADDASWPVLLEDLQTAYNHLEQGGLPRYPAKTTSWLAWSERISGLASSEELDAELPYWQSLLNKPVGLIAERAPEPSTDQGPASLIRRLDLAQTEALLVQAPPAYNTRKSDLLLIALAQTMHAHTGAEQIGLDIEGPCRGSHFANVDLSRTTGNFTCRYPIVLDVRQQEQEASIKELKQQLHLVPREGLGYGLLTQNGRLGQVTKPQIGIKYQLTEPNFAKHTLFEPDATSTGSDSHPGTQLDHPIELSISLQNSSLEISWTYEKAVIAPETIETLADAYMAQLNELISHCLAEGTGGRTPSDFPLTDLDQATVDLLLMTYPGLADIYPATQIQQGMLFHSAYSPKSDVYYDTLTLNLHGALEPEMLRKAWQATMDNTPMLRSCFAQTINEIYQVELQQAPLDWTYNSAPEEGSTAERPPTDQPPHALRLTALGGERWQMEWTFHHVLLDGWSIPLVLDEVGRHYQALRGQVAPILPKKGAYRAYMEWLAKTDKDAARTFWRDKLAGFIRANHLAPGGTKHIYGLTTKTQNHSLSQLETDTLQKFAKSLNLTLNNLLEAAWTHLIARYSGQSDVVFGTISSGRPAELANIEHMIGMLVVTLPLRADADDKRPLHQQLKAMAEQQRQAREFEYLPFPEIQAQAALEEAENLIQSILVYENFPVTESLKQTWSWLEVEEMEHNEYTNYPFTLQVYRSEQLHLNLRYESSLFEDAVAARVLPHLCRILKAMPAGKDRPMRTLPMLSQQERAQMLRLGTQTETPYPRDKTPEELFQQQATKTPEATALQAGEERITYGQLAQRASQLSRIMVRRGVGLGKVVGISLPQDDPNYHIALLAILISGACYLPIDPHWPERRRAHILKETQPSLILSTIEASDQENNEEEPEHLDPRHQTIDAEEQTVALAGPQEPAYIMYTSGTTGEPKGVMVPRRGIVRLVCTTNYLQIEPSDVILAGSVPSFDAATFEIWGALLNGATLVLSSYGDLENIDLMEKQGITIVWFTAQLFNLVMDTKIECLAKLRCLLTGGDVVSPEHVNRFKKDYPECKLINGYGPTENTTFTSCGELNNPIGERATIGRPISNTSVYVLDRELEPMLDGTAGELYIGGDGLALGYLNAPSLTAQKFLPHPHTQRPGERLYRTGDLVAYLPDHSLDFLGRVDRQVKLRGFRIELGEIESALRTLPEIADARVLARSHDGDKSLVAFIRTGEEQTAETAYPSWRAALAEQLPEYMVPSQWVMVEDYPLTPSGKLDEPALLAKDSSIVEGLRPAYEAPRNPVQQAIVDVFTEILEQDQIGIHDNFFDLGGHSLSATRAVTHLNEQLDINLPLKVLFDSGTAEKIAEYIEVLIWTQRPEEDDDDFDGEL